MGVVRCLWRRWRACCIQPLADAVLSWRRHACEEGIEQSADSTIKCDQADASVCSQGFYCDSHDWARAVPTRSLSEILGKREVSRYSADESVVTRMRSRSFFKCLCDATHYSASRFLAIFFDVVWHIYKGAEDILVDDLDSQGQCPKSTSWPAAA